VNTSLIFVGLAVVIAGVVIAIIWVRVQQLRCTTCRKFHFSESEVYYCSECGNPFCGDNVGYGEHNAIESVGWLTSISASISSISPLNNQCGGVIAVYSNTNGNQADYRCRSHWPA
jgi:hypothetical protein